MVIQVSDFFLGLIKSVLAYPAVPEELHLEDDEVKQFCLFPALEMYYNKFPIITYTELDQASVEQKISFPNDMVYGVKHASVTGKAGYGRKQGGSSDFWQVVRYNRQFIGNRKFIQGKNGRYFNPEGLRFNYIMEQNLTDSMINQGDTFKYIVDEVNKQLFSMSSINARISIAWAARSNNFDDVKQTQRMNVVKLAQAYLLRHLAYLGSMMIDTTSEKQINVDALQSNAERLETQVVEFWDSIPDILVLTSR